MKAPRPVLHGRDHGPGGADPIPGLRDGIIAVYFGSGTPEGAVTGNVGDIYVRSNGQTGTTAYEKTSGTGNTGWTARTILGGGIVEADLLLADNTTANVSTTKHGLAPKAPNDATKFLDGTAAYDTVKDSDLSLSDITTNDVSTSKHGFVPKATGGSTKFLREDATWATPSGGSGGVDYSCRAYNSTDQSITNNTTTTLAFNSERWDTDSIHDNSTNNERLTCKHAGKYLIWVNLTWDVNATGYRGGGIYFSGGYFIAQTYIAASGSAVGTGHSIVTVYDMAVNDYVECRVRQTSGGNLAMRGSGAGQLERYACEFGMMKILG